MYLGGMFVGETVVESKKQGNLCIWAACLLVKLLFELERRAMTSSLSKDDC